MPSRSEGLMPAARMPGAPCERAGSSSAAVNPDCISCSEGIVRLHYHPLVENLLRLARFVEEHIERRKIRIPFDQRAHRPEARQRFPIEIPHGSRHAVSVRVDEQTRATQRGAVEACEVDLLHGMRRDRVQIAQRIETVVDAADVDVVDVEQDAAAAAPGNQVEKLPFRDGRFGELEIARYVLDQDAATEVILSLIDVAAHHLERLFGVRQRQQIVEMEAVDRTPAQMIRHQHRLDLIDQLLELLQVVLRNTVRRAERETDSMQAQGIDLARLLEDVQRLTAARKVVLTVHLQPTHWGALIEQPSIVRRPHSDAGSCVAECGCAKGWTMMCGIHCSDSDSLRGAARKQRSSRSSAIAIIKHWTRVNGSHGSGSSANCDSSSMCSPSAASCGI